MGTRGPEADLGALDGLRAVACILIAGFHGQWWMAQLVRDQEAVETPLSQLLGGMYIIVDIFFAMTGFLSARSLFRRSLVMSSVFDACDRSSGCCSGWYASTRSRVWRIMPPLVVVMAAAAFAFGPLDRTWPRAYMRSEVNQAISELFVPSREYQSTGLQSWWTHLMHISSLAPVGGFLMHGWSLSVQYVWFLAFPAAWAVLGLSKGDRLLWFVLLFLLVHSAMRYWMWTALSGFPHPSPMAKYLQFSFYTSALARMLPCALGAAASYLVERQQHVVTWLRRDDGVAATALRAAASSCLVASVCLNIVWEHVYGHPGGGGDGAHQMLFYVLFQPGGTITAMAMAWLVFVTLTGVPLVFASPSSADARASDSSWLTVAMAAQSWKPLTASSYWLYLLHPVLFSLAMPRPHLFLPASQARIPLPKGYGLAVSPADYAMQIRPRSDLHPHSLPSIEAVTNASAQSGWIPQYQDHWLTRHAAEAGLATGAAVSWTARQADTVLVVGGLLVVATLLAAGLHFAVERPAAKLMRMLPPAALRVVSWLIDLYHGILLVALPVAHVVVNVTWLLSLSGATEPALEQALREAAFNTSQASLAEHYAHDSQWRG